MGGDEGKNPEVRWRFRTARPPRPALVCAGLGACSVLRGAQPEPGLRGAARRYAELPSAEVPRGAASGRGVSAELRGGVKSISVRDEKSQGVLSLSLSLPPPPFLFFNYYYFLCYWKMLLIQRNVHVQR